MHIVCCTDHNFIMQSGTMMKSVSFNNPNTDISFHVVIDESVSQNDRSLLLQVINQEHCKLYFHVFDPKVLKKYPRIGIYGTHVSKATYYRLFLTTILPEDVDKVLYLDGDIIVRHPLAKLWNTDLTQYAVAAVMDSDAEDILKYNQLRYSPSYGYFNAGVLLINLKYWREHHSLDAFMDIIINHPERIRFHDQDVLNIAFHDNKLDLPLTYNVQTSFMFPPTDIRIDYYKYEKALIEAIKDPVVLHFSFIPKPWTKECRHPYKQDFFKYLALTPWKSYKVKTGLDKHMRLRKLLERLGVLSKLYETPFDEKWYHINSNENL